VDAKPLYDVCPRCGGAKPETGPCPGCEPKSDRKGTSRQERAWSELPVDEMFETVYDLEVPSSRPAPTPTPAAAPREPVRPARPSTGVVPPRTPARHYLILGWMDSVELVPGRVFTIGRDPGSKLRVRQPDVSRRHAAIEWDGNPPRPLLRDVSRNQTYVNGTATARGTPSALNDGDQIRLGKSTRFVYRNVASLEVEHFGAPPPGANAPTAPPKAKTKAILAPGDAPKASPPEVSGDTTESLAPVVVAPASPVARRIPWRRRFRSLAWGAVALLCLAEVAARVLVKEDESVRGKPLGPRAFAERLDFPGSDGRAPSPPFCTDPLLGFGLEPQCEARLPFAESEHGAYLVTTNELGLRDPRTFTGKEAPGAPRVLVLGDEETFGVGVPRTAAYPARLEAGLGVELQVPIDVVNAGIPSWGQREEVAFLRWRAQAIAPKVVILQFNASNDVLDNLRYLPGDEGPLVRDPRFLEDLAEHPIFTFPLLSRLRLWRLLAWDVGRHAVYYRAMLEPSRIERTSALIRRAHDEARRLNASFVLLPLPMKPQVEGGLSELVLRSSRLNELVSAQATRDGIAVLDPLQRLRDARLRGSVPFFPHSSHLSPEGHAIVGEWLAPKVAAILRSGE